MLCASPGPPYTGAILAEEGAYTPVRRVLWQVLWLNLLVAFAKMGCGLWIGSVSLMADGFHSLFDGLSNVIALIGLWVAAHPADDNHPYGHRKFETLATVGISTPAVNAVAYGVVFATFAINWFVYRYEQRKGRELDSALLIADSQHTRSDCLKCSWAAA